MTSVETLYYVFPAELKFFPDTGILIFFVSEFKNNEGERSSGYSKLYCLEKNKVERRVRILSKCYRDQCSHSVLRFRCRTLGEIGEETVLTP